MEKVLCGLLLGLVLAAGCAYSLPALPPDHPANPDAAEAPLPAPSSTLRSADPVPEPTPPARPHGGGHEGHEEATPPAAPAGSAHEDHEGHEEHGGREEHGGHEGHGEHEGHGDPEEPEEEP